MLLVEDPDANHQIEGRDSFRASYDLEFRLDTGLTRPTRHIRTKRWRRHPIFNRDEVTRITDELSKMKRGAPVPDRYELVEISDPVVPPPAVVTAPSVVPRTIAEKPVTTASTPQPAITPVSLGVTKPVAVEAPKTGTESPAPATPKLGAAPGKFVFKFGGKKTTPATPSDATASPAPGVLSSPSPAAMPGQQPMEALPPLINRASTATPTPAPTATPPLFAPTPTNPNQMQVDPTPSLLASPAPSASPSVASQPSLAPSTSSTPAPVAPGPNREEYDAKLAQRQDLARRKVNEEANLARQLTLLQNEKNALLKRRIQDTVNGIQNNIKKLEAGIAELDAALQQFGA